MVLNILKKLPYVLCVLFIVACTKSSDGGETDGNSTLTLREQNFSTTTDGAGQAQVSFEIRSGETAFQIVGDTALAAIRLLSLTGPGNQVIVENTSDPRLSDAISFYPSPVVFNAPLLTGSISPGVYTATFEAADSRGRPITGSGVAVKVLSKRDSNFNRGTLKVNMVLVGPVGGSEDLRDGLEEGVQIWANAFDQAGIALDVQWYDFAGSDELPDPRAGSALYTSISQSVRKGALNMIVGSVVNGTNRFDTAYGRYGSSPGAAVVGPKSASVLSILSVTGRDGRFDVIGPGGIQVHNDETRFGGEELAQLAGHYLGLSHIVETASSGETARVTGTDLLSDTESSTTVLGCSQIEDVRANIMFPFPLRKYVRDQDEFNMPIEYYARDKLTPQQAAVLNRSVLVD